MALFHVGAEDIIRVNDLVIPVSLHTGAQWPKESHTPVDQLVSVSLSIFHDVSKTSETDDLKFSVNYSEITNRIRTVISSKPFLSLQDLSRSISQSIASFGLLPLLDNTLGSEILVKVKQLKAPLHTKTIAIEHLAKIKPDGSCTVLKVKHLVEDLICPIIVGINHAERLEKQDAVVNLSVDTGDQGLERKYWLDFRSFINLLYEDLSVSSFQTLEALTTSVASKTLKLLANSYHATTVGVGVAKPSALTLARSAEVEICRTISSDIHAESTPRLAQPNTQHPSITTVAIALGSNLGDSFRNIEYALRLLEIPAEILEELLFGPRPVLTVVNTSFLYETAPMYVTDQPSFINCACLVETNLSPQQVLELLKRIELIVGRVPSIRNGPRAVDLDIIFYNDIVFDTIGGGSRYGGRDLIIPHPRVQEREFVLRPLNDMIPGYIHPVLKKTVATLLQEIYDPTGRPMNKVLPIPRFPMSPLLSSAYPSILPVPETLTHWLYPSNSSVRISSRSTRKTQIMATLNVTPDSFSDGAKYGTLPAVLHYVSSSVVAGAAIVDVGGYSTRPGATFVSVEEEVARVVPAIKAIRDEATLKTLSSSDGNDAALSGDLLKRIIDVPISIDTFRWEVAEAGIKAGANFINDVYAFTGPDSWPLSPAGTVKGEQEALYMSKLKAVAREHAVPVVLMHSRGEAGKNKDYREYKYAEDNFGRGSVLEGVRVELGAKVDQVVLGSGGVRRWLVIADPGIGFSKTLDGNLELLRNAKDVVANVEIGDKSVQESYPNPLRGCPQLIGSSKKSFLGAILAQNPQGRETEPDERMWATAAAVTCAVQQGALIVRVHDVKEMADVVKVADALW